MEQHHHNALRVLADPFAPEHKWMSALNVFESGKLNRFIDKHELPVTLHSRSRMFLRRAAARLIDGCVLSIWFTGTLAMTYTFLYHYTIPFDQILLMGLFWGIVESLFLGFSLSALPHALAVGLSNPAYASACWVPFVIAAGSWYYNASNESKYGHTIGQKIMGLHLCNYKRENISFGQATVRHFTRTFSTVLFGFGFLRALTSSAGQTLHDQLARAVMLPDTRPLANVYITTRAQNPEQHQG